MPKNIKTVARDYYLALDYAYKTKDFDRLKRFLSDDCRLLALSESFVGREAVTQFLSRIIALVHQFEIRRQYFDHDSCCTVMKVITSVPDLQLNHIEWIVIREDLVIEINAVFDAIALNRFMHLIQNGDLFITAPSSVE